MTGQENKLPALVMKMQALLPTLSKSEQKVVGYIIENPEKVIYLSVAELAENSGVSDPTVVRTCQKLGLTGYQDMKVTLAQDLVSPLKSIHEEVNPEDGMQAVLDKVFQSTIHTLTFTHDTIQASDLQAAAEALIGARKILVFGLGGSSAMAADMQHKMMRLGFDATAYHDSHLQAIAACYVDKRDLVFAISHSGSSRNIVDNVRLAKNYGAAVISLTNIGRSPLSKISDIHLSTASVETKYRILAMSSRIAELAVIDTLYTYIGMRTKHNEDYRVEKAMESMKY
ncbi:putative HTH-type transcriptional regulator YbbH [bioreactor metagenome]|uniref:Putative HTH-type transcriptional regulator YbbH n=1 Tax=bioreactor metagenome TaxID=1076179 RepID=A0A645A196_9ZZZZ